MSDPLRTDGSRAPDAASGSDGKDAKIEQLLLAGLDHYFAAQYEQAINVWTRALFLDRSHARARAYIERARSALAERQRESEELLQNGVDAFARGEGDEARRLLQTAMSRGAPSEEALAVLDRIDRLEHSVAPARETSMVAITRGERPTAASPADGAKGPSLLRVAGWGTAAILVVLAAALIATLPKLPSATAALPGTAAASPTLSGKALRVLRDWRSWLLLEPVPTVSSAAPAAADTALPMPRSGEMALARARAFDASGHWRDALAQLDLVRPTDPQHLDAERLRGDLQARLVALMTAAPPPLPSRDVVPPASSNLTAPTGLTGPSAPGSVAAVTP